MRVVTRCLALLVKPKPLSQVGRDRTVTTNRSLRPDGPWVPSFALRGTLSVERVEKTRESAARQGSHHAPASLMTLQRLVVPLTKKPDAERLRGSLSRGGFCHGGYSQGRLPYKPIRWQRNTTALQKGEKTSPKTRLHNPRWWQTAP